MMTEAVVESGHLPMMALLLGTHYLTIKKKTLPLAFHFFDLN